MGTNLDERLETVYLYKNQIVCRDPKTGNCWVLRPGDYIGKHSVEEMELPLARVILGD